MVLPELFLSGYDLARARDTAVDLDGAELATVRAAAEAADTAVIVGFGERRGGAVANAVACIDARGDVAAVYRKLCLFGAEADVFEAGDELVLAELGERRVGPLICFDMEFPEPARALAAAGADLLVTAAANMEPFFDDQLIASQARALDNRLPHLYVNRAGSEGGLRVRGRHARAARGRDRRGRGGAARRGGAEHGGRRARHGRRATRLPRADPARAEGADKDDNTRSKQMSTRAPETPALFTRKATGLVREARGTDALFYNVMWASVALSFAFFWLFYGFSYPGSNAAIAFVIAVALGLPGAFMYAMLAQIMPRTGGDYVFNSRSLHPALGFAANFSYCFWLAIIYGVYTTYLAAYGFGAFGRMMAGFTGSAGWLDFGDWFSTDHGLFITGTVAVLLSAVVFIVGGLRLFLRLQVGAFALYMLGAFLLPILAGLFQSRTGFLANFNDYAANLGQDNAAGALAASAKEAGFANTGFDTRGDPQVGHGVLVHLRLPLLEQLLRGRDPDAQAHPPRGDPGGRAGGARSRSRCMLPAYLHVTGYYVQRDARLRGPGRLRLRRRRARVPGDHEHRRRQLGLRRDHHRRLRRRAADLAAADDAADEPQHVRVVVRPHHARAPVLRRPAHALADRGDRDRDGAGDRQHGDLRVHRLVQHAGGAARPLDDAARDRGRRRSCCPTASARWSRTRRTGARSPASRC